MHLPKLEFLWDEEKTRQFHKTSITVMLPACFVGVIYGLLLPADTPYRMIIAFIPLVIALSAFINLLFIDKTHQGLRFLILLMIAQTIASIFMALTGGFHSAAQFGSGIIVMYAIYQLGSTATLILGLYSFLSFLGILFWQQYFDPKPNLFQDFFLYSGIYLGIIFLLRNIGKEMSLQIEARKKLEQVDDLKNQFITLTSHYLRTPITVIKGFVADLEKTTLAPEQQGDVEKVKANVKSLEILVEKFLEISSIEKGQAKIDARPGDFSSFLEQLVEEIQPVAKAQQIEIILNAPGENINSNFDGLKLKVALFNILDNAIKFNHPDGKVIINLKVMGGYINLSISDTGQGMSKEKLSSLFTTFNKGGMSEVLTLNEPGIGLGLYLTKLTIEAHGGKIKATSVEGHGSDFIVTLPLS